MLDNAVEDLKAAESNLVIDQRTAQDCDEFFKKLLGDELDEVDALQNVYTALSDNYAAPYFGSLKWLTKERAAAVSGLILMAVTQGPGTTVLGALAIGASIVIIEISPTVGEQASEIVRVLGSKIVKRIEAQLGEE